MRPDRRRQTHPWRALYDTRRWQAVRSRQLRDHPLCAACEAMGTVTPATVVHHMTPHRGDEHLFFTSPLQSLCKPCHDRHGQEVDRRGYTSQTGPDGYPIDARHPFNKTRT